MKNYRLHFIRHGLTEANKQGLYVGRSDYELCVEGMQQLIRLKDEYEYPKVQVVYSSPLARCLQTADIIYPDNQLVVEDGLIEMDFGEFEGKSFFDLQSDPDFIEWLKNSLEGAPRGGESGFDFTNRVINVCDKIFNDMMQQSLSDVAVVTHGGVIMTLMAALGIPKLPFKEWAVGNGMGFTVIMTPQMWMRDHAFEIAGIMPHGATSTMPEQIHQALGGDEVFEQQ